MNDADQKPAADVTEATPASKDKETPDVNDVTMADFKRLGPAGILMLLWAILPLVDSSLLIAYMDTTGRYLRDHGTQGLVIYTIGFAVLAGAGLMPTYISAALGGWAFGFERGFPAALIGFVAASLIGRAIAKPTSKDRLETLIAEKPKWKAVRDALIGGSPLRTFGIVTMLRVPPNSPFAITNFLLASTRVPLFTYTFATLIGMAPRTGLVLYVASKVQNRVATDAKNVPDWFIELGIAVAVGVLIALWFIADKALQKLTGGDQAPAI